MSIHDTGFQAALDEAKAGANEGGVPIGACLVNKDGKILGRGHNLRVQNGSATLHVSLWSFPCSCCHIDFHLSRFEFKVLFCGMFGRRYSLSSSNPRIEITESVRPTTLISYHSRLSCSQQAEISALESAGRLPPAAYKGATMYTTLSPCDMCTGACILYNVSRVVMGENRTFVGGEDYLHSKGIEVINLKSDECRELMTRFIREHPEDWYVSRLLYQCLCLTSTTGVKVILRLTRTMQV